MKQLITPNPPGTNLARYVFALCQTKGRLSIAVELAEQRWPDSPAVALTLKAAVAALGTANTSALTTYGVGQELVALVRGASVLGRLSPFMRSVPFRTRLSRETTGAQSGWVGEGNPKPLSSLALDNVTLEVYKSATMAVFTEALMKVSSPAAEAVVRNSMVAGVAAHLDAKFLDPTITAIANVRPASITNGATSVTSTGATAAAITTDLSAMMAALASWGYPVWVMKPSTAAALAGKTNTSGNPQFPNISVLGGSLLGIPVVVSTNSPQQITLLDAADVLLADEGATEISFAKDASVLMDDAPELSPMTSSLVSLWQHDYIGVLVERWISWARAHDTSVTYMVTAY